MKAKGFLLLVMAICLASGVKAQFYDSEQVYCYEYQYTMQDGIKSQPLTGRYVFVNFQNDMIGFYVTDKSEVASKGVNYFEDKARNELAKNYRKWKYNPANAMEQADIYPYDSSNSSGSRYTYRRQTKYSDMSFAWGVMSYFWHDAFWNGDCYTFSSDRNEFVEWYLSKPLSRFNFNFNGVSTPTDYTSIRRHYKLIDANKLKPSVDDIW